MVPDPAGMLACGTPGTFDPAVMSPARDATSRYFASDAPWTSGRSRSMAITTVAAADDQHHEPVVVNLVDDPIVTDPHPIHAVLPLRVTLTTPVGVRLRGRRSQPGSAAARAVGAEEAT